MADSTKLVRYKQVDPTDKSDIGNYYVKTKNGVFVKIDHIRIFEGDRSIRSTPTFRQIGKKNQKFSIYKERESEKEYNQILAKEGSATFTLADSNIYERYEAENMVVQKFVRNAEKVKDSKIEYSLYTSALPEDAENLPLFIRVRFKGDTADTVVPIRSLRALDNSPIFSEETGEVDFDSLVGKNYTVEGDYRETEPLTEEQAKPLTSKKFIYKSTLDSDICRVDESTHTTANLRVKGGDLNGQYVREIDVVQPKCYNYTDDRTKCDAFLVTDEEGNSYVVSKRFKPFRNPAIVLCGKRQIEFNEGDDGNVQYLVKSSGGIINSDVIQTSSVSTDNANVAHNCKVVDVNKRKIDLLNPEDDETSTKKELAAQIKAIYEQFLIDYKAKRYDLGNEILIMQPDADNPEKVKGEFVNYVLNHRYMISDNMPMQDFGITEITEILNMPENGFKFDGSKLNGGAKYDRKKGVIDSFNKFGDGVAYALGFTFSAGGALAALISPFLLVGLAAGMVGWAAVIPIYHTLKKHKVESPRPRKNIYPSKIEKQNQKVKDTIFEEIEQIIASVKLDDEEMQKLSPEKREAALKEREKQFLAEMSIAECKLELLNASKHGGEFSAADGRVDQSNTEEFDAYLSQINDISSEISTLQKQLKGKSISSADRQIKIDRLSVLQIQLDDLKTKFHSSGSESELDPEQSKIRKRIEQAKGFILVKYYGREIAVEGASSEEEKLKLQTEYKEFARTTDIKVDKKHKKFKYLHHVKKGERSIRRRRLWKKRNKRSKGFFSRIAAIGTDLSLDIDEKETSNAYDELCKVSYTNGHEHVEDLEEELKKEHHEEKEHEKERKKAKAKEKDETKVREKRSITGLSVADAEKCIIEVCKAMEELSGVMDKYFGDNELTGAANESEDYMKKLAHIYDYNENVLKAVYKDRRTTLFKQLNMKYSSRITTAAKRYKDYMTYFENKIVPSL